MSLPDYDLFPKLKERLWGIRFDDLNVLEEEVTGQMRHMNFCCLATGIVMLPERWKSITEHKGDYIEGLLIFWMIN